MPKQTASPQTAVSQLALPIKTPEAARRMGVPYSHVVSLLRGGKMPLPAKDSSGDFCWTEADLANARAALTAGRRSKAKSPGGPRDAA